MRTAVLLALAALALTGCTRNAAPTNEESVAAILDYVDAQSEGHLALAGLKLDDQRLDEKSETCVLRISTSVVTTSPGFMSTGFGFSKLQNFSEGISTLNALARASASGQPIRVHPFGRIAAQALVSMQKWEHGWRIQSVEVTEWQMERHHQTVQTLKERLNSEQTTSGRGHAGTIRSMVGLWHVAQNPKDTGFGLLVRANGDYAMFESTAPEDQSAHQRSTVRGTVRVEGATARWTTNGGKNDSARITSVVIRDNLVVELTMEYPGEKTPWTYSRIAGFEPLSMGSDARQPVFFKTVPR